MRLPGLPQNESGPVFRAPWEAQAFALTLNLFERGCFTWQEWAEHLGAEIAKVHARGEYDDGSRYYEHWLAALEQLAARKALVTPAEMLARKHEWDLAARSTPHGKPIMLPGR